MPAKFMQLASDAFPYANGDLHTANANWVYSVGSFLVSSNKCYANANPCLAYRSDVGVQTDQYADFTCVITVASGTQNCGPAVRVQPGATSGYYVQLGSDQTQLTRNVTGTNTALATVATGYFATGDVCRLAIVGNALTVYKNGMALPGFTGIVDTTFASGYLGMFGAAALTDNGASVWAGGTVSNTQGIWTKLGTVITPLAADSNTVLFGGTSNQDVLYDINPQLISANPDGHVFKMWFMGKNDLFYAESNDGISWTRRGTALLLATGQPRVWKDSGTYYVYVTTGEPTQGTQGVTVYTSSDGITLASQGVGLAVGAGFDASGVFYLKPWFKTGSTWSGYYATSAGPAIATSSDLIHWTNAAGPIAGIPAGGGDGGYPLFINGVYYIYTAWATAGGANGQNVKTSSTDLSHWTSYVVTVPETQSNEGAPLGAILTTSEGQGVPTVLTGLNGWTYFYYSGTAVATGAAYLVMGAVTQTPLAQVVTSNEGLFVANITLGAQTALDNMTRANETPLSDGGNWTVQASPNVAANLVSNQAVASSTSFASRMAFTGATWGSGEWAKVILGSASVDANDQVGPMVDTSTSQVQGYLYFASGPSAFSLVAFLPGGAASITLQNGPQTNVTGDTFEIAIAGSEIQCFHNGTLVATAYDSMWRSGPPGFHPYDSPTASVAAINNWSGGAAIAPPVGGTPASGGGDLGPGYDFKFRM